MSKNLVAHACCPRALPRALPHATPDVRPDQPASPGGADAPRSVLSVRQCAHLDGGLADRALHGRGRLHAQGTIPTGECVHHHGHQCTKCKGWYHNPCVGAVEPDECGRCDEASSGAGLSDGAKVTDPPQIKPTDTGLTAHHVEDGGSESSHAHLKRDSAKPAPVTPQVTSRAAG